MYSKYNPFPFFGYSAKDCFYLLIVFCILTLLSLSLIRFKKKFLIGSFYLFVVIIIFSKVDKSHYQNLFFMMLLPSLIIGLLIGLGLVPEKVDPVFDVPFETSKGIKYMRKITRGTLILGSAGSGKTESPIYAMLKHLAEKRFTGIIYDYKDGELTEIAKALFAERLRIVCLHDPSLGLRINPISSRYIKDEKDVLEVSQVLIDNLGTGADKPSFFDENATALLGAIILKFHLYHPEYCTLPHVIAFILVGDFEDRTVAVHDGDNLRDIAEAKFKVLKDFLTSDNRVAMQASPFLMGLASEKQTAAVLSTLANALRKLAFPEAFWVLSGDEVLLDVNDKGNDTVLSVINEPKTDSFLSPILATIIHTATKQMMVRNQLPSFVLLDEAPTIKLRNMARLPSTMRSFGVSTIYCMQDLSQGVMQYGRDGIKEIISNLSIQFFGKTNDPDTGKFYEGYFGFIKEKTKSISYKGSGNIFSTSSGNTIGEREISEVRSNAFFQFKQGQFAFLSNGKGEVLQFKRSEIKKEKLTSIKTNGKDKYINNYNTIISQVNSIINSNIV